MHVLANPVLPEGSTPQHNGCASGPLVRCAGFRVARGVKHCHADSGQAVARDDGPQIVEPPPEPVDAAPDRSPLLFFSGVATDSEWVEAPKGNQVLGKQRSSPDEVNGLGAHAGLFGPTPWSGRAVATTG